MMRADSVLVGFVLGVATVAVAVGIYQMLISKGYAIAVELAEAGWTTADMRRHKKAAIILPWLETMREPGAKVVPIERNGRT